MTTLRIIGPGRAGRSLAGALEATGAWTVAGMLGREDDVSGAAIGVDLLVIATPDVSIGRVAAAVEPGDAVVAHLAGSRGLSVLAPHADEQRAALHPLVALPNAEVGARRLAGGAWFAVAGHPIVEQIVDELGGHRFTVEDEQRAAYHAAACIASNHLVALLGQVDRVGGTAGVPLGAYVDLVRTTVENVAALGPSAALTGPAARGDWETIERHRAALEPSELAAYDAMVDLARRLAAG
ncbi:MAG: DUF2520 domain-containing protein [Actinobacteria bacterium]|nr:DUF2520 domain-containing protein [Actinomycetota bacterium]